MTVDTSTAAERPAHHHHPPNHPPSTVLDTRTRETSNGRVTVFSKRVATCAALKFRPTSIVQLRLCVFVSMLHIWRCLCLQTRWMDQQIKSKKELKQGKGL